MPERNILASFTLPERARKCQEELRSKGFDVVQVDAVSSGEQVPPHSPVVEWGRYGYEANMLDDKWTSASAWDNGGLILGESWLLTAVVPEQDGDRVERIIRQYGGSL